MSEVDNDFKTVGLNDAIVDNLTSLGYVKMTPIQKEGLPPILENKDIIGQANTGSGKTAAFGLGILAKLDVSNLETQALVIVPTRELADQVTNEIRRLARFASNVKVITLAGGTQERHKLTSLKQGAHIVVGTTGRLLKLLETKVLSAKYVNTLVLDEADRLLEMGSIKDIETIAAHTPIDRQTMLFSATFPNGIRKLSESIQEYAAQVTIDSQHKNTTIKQVFFKVEDKNLALVRLLSNYKPESCLIFCNSKDECNRVVKWLGRNKMNSMALHSDLEQKDRTLTLIKFDNKSCRIIVATDLASRGLDIKDVGAVINYDLPKDTEKYVHRIGRTGRAGSEGLALNLYLSNQRPILMAISDYLKKDCPRMDIEELDVYRARTVKPLMVTLYISGGKKDGIRPGDVLGALTKDAGLVGDDVGKIHILDINSYVAIKPEKVDQALKYFVNGKIKKKKFKVGKA